MDVTCLEDAAVVETHAMAQMQTIDVPLLEDLPPLGERRNEEGRS